MSKLKYYGGVVLGVAASLFVLNFVLKAVAPGWRGWFGLNG